MGSQYAIEANGLSKRYRLGGLQPAYGTFRDALTGLLRRSKIGNQDATTLWALRGATFNVAPGEVVGLIGRNGAGKSTLLKILSRITAPTDGTAVLRGRVGSLLEVGTGFHGELTGKENIYLNGAILGMRSREVAAAYDSIVTFAEVERFLDTPVKHYSTGMYLRLAFAVAAHLNPEILLVDEVLAVGDAAFQKKCLGKVRDVARQGRTVILVSHNLTAITSLCVRTLWLADGTVMRDGPTQEVISAYLSESAPPLQEQVWPDSATAPGNDAVRLRRAAVHVSAGDSSPTITVSTPVTIEFEYWNLVPGARLNLSLHVSTETGTLAFVTTTVGEANWHGREFPAGLFKSTCAIPGGLLNDGRYRCDLLLVKDEALLVHRFDDIATIDVLDSGDGRGQWYGRWLGALRPRLEWQTSSLD
jgi:lipopolysaccharide transport system ATP-binding protein